MLCALELREERCQLLVTADERRLEPRRPPGGTRREREQPPRRDRLALSFQLERRQQLRLDHVAHERMRRIAEQDLPGGCTLLQSGGDVDGVAGDERVHAGLSGHHLAGVDAGVVRKPDAVQRFELVVERLELRTHLDCRAHRAHRVVLVGHGDPEHREHRVADELLDPAAVAGQDAAELVEVAAQHPPHRLGVVVLSELGRAGEIAEDDGHDLASLRPRCGDHRPAGRAEARTLREGCPALGARRHRPTIRPDAHPRKRWEAR